MLIIGENIHIISPKVRKAVADRDAETIQHMATLQVEHGADILDLNIGPQKRRGVEIMYWMVDAVQEVTDAPLSLDTTNMAAIETGTPIFMFSIRFGIVLSSQTLSRLSDRSFALFFTISG